MITIVSTKISTNINVEAFIVTAVKVKNAWNVVKAMEDDFRKPNNIIIVTLVKNYVVTMVNYYFYYSGNFISLCTSVKNVGKGKKLLPSVHFNSLSY